MLNDVIIRPKTPDSLAWTFIDYYSVMGFPAERWRSLFGHVAVTAVEVADEPGHESLGPEYHVSFSKFGGRVPADEIPELLKVWDMEGSEEDNHVKGGIARNFWMPVADKYAGYICPCKDAEQAIIEGDYVWRQIA